jgi:hypothetical protein
VVVVVRVQGNYVLHIDPSITINICKINSLLTSFPIFTSIFTNLIVQFITLLFLPVLKNHSGNIFFDSTQTLEQYAMAISATTTNNVTYKTLS